MTILFACSGWCQIVQWFVNVFQFAEVLQRHCHLFKSEPCSKTFADNDFSLIQKGWWIRPEMAQGTYYPGCSCNYCPCTRRMMLTSIIFPLCPWKAGFNCSCKGHPTGQKSTVSNGFWWFYITTVLPLRSSSLSSQEKWPSSNFPEFALFKAENKKLVVRPRDLHEMDK